ncbi:MAG: hypothetical protein K2W86_17690 [Sphingomonas sp.]|uniref:hypothetical protein n=1 Tax=Sphingomonas sp. TaxID=28214 RepID=UPI0035A8571E|nr:hypothetical protein [Sphingomonas sp.]
MTGTDAGLGRLLNGVRAVTGTGALDGMGSGRSSPIDGRACSGDADGDAGAVGSGVGDDRVVGLGEGCALGSGAIADGAPLPTVGDAAARRCGSRTAMPVTSSLRSASGVTSGGRSAGRAARPGVDIGGLGAAEGPAAGAF